jgi:hypothetical protein
VSETKQILFGFGNMLSGKVKQPKSKQADKEEPMMNLQAFQIAATEGGFVAESGVGEETVQWLKKIPPHMARNTHQRMCIDTLTSSVTVYWVGVPGKLNSKTFRTVAALQEWVQLEPQTVEER